MRWQRRDVQRAQDAGATTHHLRNLEALWVTVLARVGADTPMVRLAQNIFDTSQAYIGTRRQEGVRGQTIRREIAAMKRAFQICSRRGLLDEGPYHWPAIKSDPPSQARSGKLHSVEAIHQLIGVLPQEAADLLGFVAWTGLRATEAKKVEWPWVTQHALGVDGVAAILNVPARGREKPKGSVSRSFGSRFGLVGASPNRRGSGRAAVHAGQSQKGRSKRLCAPRLGTSNPSGSPAHLRGTGFARHI